jgi:electron transfer flavoprotein beta subunit
MAVNSILLRGQLEIPEGLLLHSIVCIKQVPDTTNIRIDPETGNLIRQGIPTILNPYDAHAVAAAVEWKRALGGKVTVITMGPPAAASSLRECIEMGADRGILLSARQFAGADTLSTSYVLAETIRHLQETDPADLIFFGKQAIDGDTAQVGPGVAVRLGAPLVTYAVKIHALDLAGRTVDVERKTENRNEVIRAALPAVLTCEKDIAEIPFASLPDLVASLRYEPEVWTAEAPIRFDPEKIGLKGSPTMVHKTGTPEKHAAGELLPAGNGSVDAAVRNALEKIRNAGCAPALSALSGAEAPSGVQAPSGAQAPSRVQA